ncbi:hypothetical protein CC86DRAFT_374300 [Ophiobolus disseminans]|uniref:Uncharacterized protein n=1 Tax=Ophiobolus disseminans TaxID=1469910 RepID=A0A6A6ZK41_9PLEO|nr:hypothetical protein CC86DRAFT_374300 [Ophiobolus disseminans]
MSGYHGRSFQMIRAKLEEVFPCLLAMPVYLAGYNSIVSAWHLMKELPSRHDMLVYALTNVSLSSHHTMNAKIMVDLMDGLYRYKPRNLLEQLQTDDYKGESLTDERDIYLKLPNKNDILTQIRKDREAGVDKVEAGLETGDGEVGPSNEVVEDQQAIPEEEVPEAEGSDVGEPEVKDPVVIKQGTQEPGERSLSASVLYMLEGFFV